MAMSREVDGRHTAMAYRRHHTAPGSSAQHQSTREQRTHLSSTATETPDEHSRMPSICEIIYNVCSQVRRFILLAMTLLYLMWKYIQTFTSMWFSKACRRHPENNRIPSVSAVMDMLVYSCEKCKGESCKAKQIKKAYEHVYTEYNIKNLQTIREDNYCVLRAIIFKVFSQQIPYPGWMKEKDIVKFPEKLMYSQGCNWLEQFGFGPEKYAGSKVCGKLRSCLELFKNEWGGFYATKDRAELNNLCWELFCDDTKERKVYEALKFIMLYLVIEAHENMKTGAEVPSFFHFLFSRDTSTDPLSYMINHLNMVGDTIGLDQAELCLVGYALELKINLLRLTKFTTEDFETIYPADHKQEWHEITLMTDDDRHYTLPVIKSATNLPSDTLMPFCFRPPTI